jgi:hypothetical protein
MTIQSGGFLPATALNRKKRQTSNTSVKKCLIISSVLSFSTVTCERATGLNGDLFVTQYKIQYPPTCLTSNCRLRYLNTIQNALRMDNRSITVVMNFTNGETRNVQLTFCSFSTPGKLTIHTEGY